MTTTENYFKALGWEKIKGGWRSPETETELIWSVTSLPNITQSYPDFKKWVLEKMEGEGWRYEIEDGTGYWMKYIEEECCGSLEHVIKDNEILEAAVIAATRYWEEKNNGRD